MQYIVLAIVAYFIYAKYFGEESGCEKYASKYSCNYVINKASYDVYYWKYLPNEDPANEVFIGHTVGLDSCKNIAINYSVQIREPWNDRAYICILVRDSGYQEKHRLLY